MNKGYNQHTTYNHKEGTWNIRKEHKEHKEYSVTRKAPFQQETETERVREWRLIPGFLRKHVHTISLSHTIICQTHPHTIQTHEENIRYVCVCQCLCYCLNAGPQGRSNAVCTSPHPKNQQSCIFTRDILYNA